MNSNTSHSFAPRATGKVKPLEKTPEIVAAKGF